MTIFVGSDNPVKIEAVRQAVIGHWPDVVARAQPVASGVSEQPRSDEETRQGAQNRARAALSAGLAGLAEHAKTTQDAPDEQVAVGREPTTLGIGLEGGVYTAEDGSLYSTVWVAVVDQDDQLFAANGARFQLHNAIADPIKQGQEMGPVMNKLIGQSDVRKKQGMIGIVTNGFVDRTQEYASIVRVAVGLWYGRSWYTK